MNLGPPPVDYVTKYLGFLYPIVIYLVISRPNLCRCLSFEYMYCAVIFAVGNFSMAFKFTRIMIVFSFRFFIPSEFSPGIEGRRQVLGRDPEGFSAHPRDNKERIPDSFCEPSSAFSGKE